MNAQTALNLVSLFASRTAERSDAAGVGRSTSFCAAEASVRVPLDSLRTCERKCRRLNARGRSSFNCLPLVTRPERAEKREGEKGDARARFSWERSCSLLAFCRGFLCRHQSRPTANLSQHTSSACESLAARIRLRALPWRFLATFFISKSRCY